MKAIKILFPGAFVCSLFSSCLNLETIINVDIPEHTPKLVLNELHYSDTTFCFQISRSRSILNDASLDNTSNCRVELYENGVLLEKIRAGFDRFYRSTHKPKEGASYKVMVYDTVNNDAVHASTDQPMALKDALIKTVTQEAGENGFTQVLNTSFQFRDPDPGVRNYFRIRVLRYDPVYNSYNNINFKSSDPVLSDVIPSDFGNETDDGYMYFYDWAYCNDELFDGKQKDFRILISDDTFDGASGGSINPVYLEIQHLSADFYRYALTSQLYDYTRGDPFATPVKVYNNIQDGYGIFAGAYRVLLKVK